MAKRLECIFKAVNGENTGAWTRTAMTKNSPSPGILYMKNCPDGKTFYCDPTDGGTNSYYKLIDPETYGIKSSGKVYAYLDRSFLVSWKEVEWNESENKENKPPETPKTNTSNTIKTTSNAISAVNNSTKSPTHTSTTYKNGQTTTSSKNYGSSSSAWVKASAASTYESSAPYIHDNVQRDTFFNDYSSFDDNLKIIERNLNIGVRKSNVDDIRYNMVNKFNRFKVAYPDLQLSKSFSHVFFTRPDLNLYSNSGQLTSRVEQDEVFYYLNKNSPQLLKSLTRDFSKTHDFNPFLSNMAGSFELKDEMVQTVDVGQTFTGHKMKYGRHNIESKTADSFSITYVDDEDYQIYKIHKAWTDYISNVYRGTFHSRSDNIRNRVLDYACSVYYFLCGPDGETILFWSKYTGVFPTNTPSAASSWSRGSHIKLPEFTINYDYAWKEDFNPLSLAEFNINSKSNKASSFTYAKTYEPELATTGKTFVGAPFIESSVGAGGYTFKLRFKMP